MSLARQALSSKSNVDEQMKYRAADEVFVSESTIVQCVKYWPAGLRSFSASIIHDASNIVQGVKHYSGG